MVTTPPTISDRLDNLRRSADDINAKLRGMKRMDVFECARLIQTKWTVEETVSNMVVLLKEGKFDHIGLSECSADSISRASAVSLFMLKPQFPY